MNKTKSILITFAMSAFFVTTSLSDTVQQKKLQQQKQKQLQQQKQKQLQQQKQKQLQELKTTSVQQSGVDGDRRKSKFQKFNEKVGKALSIKEGGKANKFLRGGKFIKSLTVSEQGNLEKLFRAKAITSKLTSRKKRYGELSESEKISFRNSLTSSEQSFIDNLIDDGTINSIDELFVENNKIGKFFRAKRLYDSDSLIYELNSADSFLLAEEYLNQNPKLKRR